MMNPGIEIHNLTSIQPEAVGEPGQRTFRITLHDAIYYIVMWLEKEQLFQLAVAITQLEATVPTDMNITHEYDPGREIPHKTNVEFTVGKLVLGHESQNDRFIIDAHDIDTRDDGPPSVRIWCDREILISFSEESLKVCVSGRPICPLCGKPIDQSGHKCPKANGHQVHDLNET